MDNKESSFSKYQKKLRIENLIKSGFFAIFASFAFTALICFILWSLNLKIWWVVLIITILSLVGSFFLGMKKLFIPKDANMAVRVDKLGLQDRAVTMVQYKDCDSVMARMQRMDAEEKIETVEPKQVKFKFPLPLLIAAGVAFAVGIPSYFLPDRVPVAEVDTRTAYTVTFNSNGGTFESAFLFDNNFDESKVQKVEVKNDKGEVVQIDEVITATTELSNDELKFLPANLFANNQGISKHGYSLVGWNTKTTNANGTPVTETLNYMSGVRVDKDNFYTFYAIWSSIDQIIQDLLDDLRDIVDNADVDPSLKDELHQEIDQFEEEITKSDLSNQDKIDTTKEFQEEIIGKLEAAEEELKDQNQSAADELIQGGQEIGSDALENLGQAIEKGDKESINDALDKIIEETKDLNDKELQDKLDQITDVIDKATDAAKQEGNEGLSEALGNLSSGLKDAGVQAGEGENEGAHETIKDAVDQAKDELGMTAGESGNVGNMKEEINSTLNEALGKLEGQTGQPTGNPNENPNLGENPGSGQTPGTSNPTGNAGSGQNPGTSNPTGNPSSGQNPGTSNPTGNPSSNKNPGTSNPTGNPSSNHTPGSNNTGEDTGNSGGTPPEMEVEYETVIDGETSYKDVLEGSVEEIYAKLESGEIPSEYVEIIKNYLETLENQ